MTPAAEPFHAALGACADLLARLTRRVDGRMGVSPDDATWGHVGDANRLLDTLRDAALAAGLRDVAGPGNGAVLGAEDLPVVASGVCPECGAEEVGTVESVHGLAHGRVEEGRFMPSGQTDLDWDGARSLRTPSGTVLACQACETLWIHPALDLDGP